MKFLLLWIVISGNGLATSSATFENQAACEKAMHSIAGMMGVPGTETYRDPLGFRLAIIARCVPAGSIQK